MSRDLELEGVAADRRLRHQLGFVFSCRHWLVVYNLNHYSHKQAILARGRSGQQGILFMFYGTWSYYSASVSLPR
jgi:hypothetical protein